jgi:hypothetical protein
MFAPLEVGDSVNPGKPAFGMLQGDGSYTLTTYTAGDGAILGEHWVTIVNLDDASKQGAGSATSGTFSRLTLPERVTVQAEAPNQFDFNVSDEVVRRFGVQLRD